MTMKGDAKITMEQGDKYKDAGASAVRTNKIFSSMKKDVAVDKEGKVDTNKEGTYTITYTAKYHNQKKEMQRTVVVQNTRPVITLRGGKNFTVYRKHIIFCG